MADQTVMTRRAERLSILKGALFLGGTILLGFVCAYGLVSNPNNKLNRYDALQQNSLTHAMGLKRREAPRMTSQPSTTPWTSTLPNGQTVPATTTLEELLGSNSTLDNKITTTPPGSSTAYEQKTTTLPTTTPVYVKPCFRKGYPIRDSCDVTAFVNTSYGENVTLENIGHMLFKTELLDRLEDKCKDGEWCEPDDWLLVADDNDYLDFCYVGECLLDNMPDHCMDKKRLLIINTLRLMCDAVDATYNITDQCYIAMRKITHVTMENLNMAGEDVRETCGNETDTCSDTCHQMSRGLYCLSDICRHMDEIYQTFSDWVWYFRDDNVTERCNIGNETTCSFLASPEESWFDNFWGKLQNVQVSDVIDGRVLTAIIISGVVMVAGVAVSVWACVKKGPGLKRYARNTIEYSKVDGDEDDFEEA